MKPFSINSESVDRARVIGIGEHRLLLIDDFFTDPDAVRAAALDPKRRWTQPSGGYPGILAHPEPENLGELVSFFKKLLQRPLRPNDQVTFSMVTMTDEELAPQQRRPHFDGSCFGGLVYLNSPAQCRGGTGFFRHRSTGLTSYPAKENNVTREVMSKLGLTSLAELQQLVMAPPRMDAGGYIADSNSEWERFFFVDMKFNRFIIYDGEIFHSAIIRNGDFGIAPHERRLTLNFFVDR